MTFSLFSFSYIYARMQFAYLCAQVLIVVKYMNVNACGTRRLMLEITFHYSKQD